MEAPDNVLPLHPKSALPEQRHLLLVHERPSPPRGTPAPEAVCRRGRHPLTPREWERVPQWGCQGTAAEPPELHRAWAAHSKHRQTLSVEQKRHLSHNSACVMCDLDSLLHPGAFPKAHLAPNPMGWLRMARGPPAAGAPAGQPSLGLQHPRWILAQAPPTPGGPSAFPGF